MTTTKSETTVERVGGYRVVRRLATGGTSDVLLAKAEGPLGFERTVVLKILLSEFRSDDELARMFAREAYAYARLGHPAIVRLFDFFSLPTSRTVGSELPGPPSTRRPPRSADEAQLVMVLEHVDGPALSRLRSLLKAIGRQMDDHAAIWIASRIFAALAAAHAATDESGALAPVIHRDVNPSNVLVPWDGEVKLADFGVAKVMGQNGESVAGMIKGTYGYMAPEQVTGGSLTPAADVYAGAIILWELLARRRAFQRTGKPEVEALRAMMEPNLPSIDTLRPDVDGTVRAALNRALEPKADKRTITAEELVGILQRAVPGHEGRDRLVAILGLVRNDARISNAPMSAADPSMRPVPTAAGATETAVSPPMRVPPPAGSSTPSSSRRVVVRPSGTGRAATAPYGNPASRPNLPAAAPSSGSTLGPPARTTSRGGMGAVRDTPSRTKLPASRPSLPGVHNETPSRTKILVPSPTQVSATSEPPRRPSASHRLAQAIPETMRDPAEHLNVPTPVVQVETPRNVRESIDEILEGPITPNETGRFKRTDAIGRIPASPGPLRSAATPAVDLPIQDFPKATKAFDSSASPDFGGTGRQSQPDVGGVLPTVTPRGGFERTVAMEGRPVEARQEPTHPSAKFEEATKRSVDVGATGPMPAYVPPAPTTPSQPQVPTTPSRPQMAAVQPHPTAPMQAVTPPAPAVALGAMPSAPPPQPVASRPAPAPAASSPRRSNAPLAIGACLAIVIGAVIAGSVTYARGQARDRLRASQLAATMSATAPTPTEAPSASVTIEPASASASAAPAPSIEPSAMASSAPSAEPVASAAPTPSAEPAPGASAASASASPGGTEGLLKTTGALPGRRIFVDTAVVGQTPESVTVKCGQHVVRLGSSGKNQTVDVPCGGELVVADKY